MDTALRDEILSDLRGLCTTPRALILSGPNPIAPDCPQEGLFFVQQWACTTKSCAWADGCAPQGWPELVREEGDTGRCPEFVVIWDRPPQGVRQKGFCIRLDDDFFTPLFTAPDDSRLVDIADYIGDIY